MMPRQVYLLGVGMTLVALAFLLTEALLWQPGVTEANVKRIRAGMTIAEAEAILGKHAARWGPKTLVWPMPEMAEYSILVVELDTGGRVAWVKVAVERGVFVLVPVSEYRFRRAPSPPFSRLRAWIGW